MFQIYLHEHFISISSLLYKYSKLGNSIISMRRSQRDKTNKVKIRLIKKK